MISLIRALSSSAKEAKFIRDELTVIVMPRVNIDGFDATPTGEPWRYNVDPERLHRPHHVRPSMGAARDTTSTGTIPTSTDYPLDNPNTARCSDDDNPVPESLNMPGHLRRCRRGPMRSRW
ncbi:MAG: hypothetical protein MZV70_06200 [Desulfobacterales bacterium]|nr:hypothetical protein [Desulfobacterales bacterium]